MEPDFLAIVDPWVTTLSFVVALAMGIQDFFPANFRRNNGVQ